MRLLHPDGREQSLTHPHTLWADWTRAGATGAAWPTWSPDGLTIAAFVLEGGAGTGPSVRLCRVDGGLDSSSGPLPPGLPIHISWSPSGERLATLFQQDDGLMLHAWTMDLEHPRLLATSSPLFYRWAGEQLAAYLGAHGANLARMVLLHPEGTVESRFPYEPCNFCTPLWRDPDVLYVADLEGTPTLLRASADTLLPTPLESQKGLVAITLSPGGKAIARASAPDAEGQPYDDLALVDPTTGEAVPVRADACLAWIWTPDGTGLVIASIDEESKLVVWSLLDLGTGSERELVRLRPTRELAFYLRFFEQYVDTHPIIHPDGTGIVVAGALGDGPVDRVQPALWWVPLDGGPPEEMVPGVLGVFPRAERMG